jgi:cell division septation protein DedD
VIGTLAVLAAAAFALGAGAGLLWQEPRLVVADLLGDTQEVPWAQAQDPKAWPEGENDGGEETAAAEATRPVAASAPAAESAPAVAAAPVAPAKPAAAEKPVQVAVAKPAAARPAATPAVSAAPPAHGGLSVQVGAFGDRAAANALVAKLKGSGYPAYVASGSARPFRVRVGPYADRAKADVAAGKLAKLSLPTWVQEEPGSR